MSERETCPACHDYVRYVTDVIGRVRAVCPHCDDGRPHGRARYLANIARERDAVPAVVVSPTCAFRGCGAVLVRRRAGQLYCDRRCSDRASRQRHRERLAARERERRQARGRAGWETRRAKASRGNDTPLHMERSEETNTRDPDPRSEVRRRASALDPAVRADASGALPQGGEAVVRDGDAPGGVVPGRGRVSRGAAGGRAADERRVVRAGLSVVGDGGEQEPVRGVGGVRGSVGDHGPRGVLGALARPAA